MFPDPLKTAAMWREVSAAKKLGIRDTVIQMTGGQTFVGTASFVAETMNDFVQQNGSDGFVLAPHLTPTGLDDFVDDVVPLLQERGVLRTEYETTTLRGTSAWGCRSARAERGAVQVPHEPVGAPGWTRWSSVPGSVK